LTENQLPLCSPASLIPRLESPAVKGKRKQKGYTVNTSQRIFAIAAILAVTVAGYLLAGGRHSHPLFKIVVLARYSWFIAVGEMAAAITAMFGPRELQALLQNVFILDNGLQLCFVTWISLLLGTAILVTYRTTKINAPYRFTDFRESLQRYRAPGPPTTAALGVWQNMMRVWNQMIYALLDSQLRKKNFWRKRWGYLAAVGLPIPVASFYLSWFDLFESGGGGALTFIELLAGLLGGIAIWVVIMLLITLLQQLVLSRERVDIGLFPFDRFPLIHPKKNLAVHGVGYRVAKVISRLGPGFAQQDIQTQRWRLRPGHAQLAIFASILLLAYTISLLHSSPPRLHWYSALFGLLTKILLVCLLTTGAAFVLDYFRIPLLLSLLCVSLFTWSVTRADSFFALEEGAQFDPPPLEKLIVANEPAPKETLVVVTCAGGGIQAAGWTAQVLTGLSEVYGPDFTRSLAVVSAVSGGSVGTMFYLDRWPDLSCEAVRRDVRDKAMQSSLEATAWGWSGWDTVKSLAPFIVPTLKDRGWAIEQSWQPGLTGCKPTLGNWADRARSSRFPVVVFNATVVESGKRLMISNARCLPASDQIPSAWGSREGMQSVEAVQFVDYCQGRDIPLVTAARLSATFPYVSPICRPHGIENGLHVADGGYVDNEGMVSALQWLRDLVRHRAKGANDLRFRQVLLIRILPFQDEDPSFPKSGWLYAFYGPAETMVKVRSSSQLERNYIALALNREVMRLQNPDLEFREAKFQFRNVRKDQSPPLSWRLSNTQKAAIGSAWKALVREHDSKGNPFHEIDKWFTFNTPSLDGP
jgi:hypothetical protein